MKRLVGIKQVRGQDIQMKILHKRLRRNQIGGSNMAEFGPAMIIFFLVTLFPLINFLGFAMGSATAYMAAKQCATRASTQSTFTDALAVVQTESATFVNSGLGRFAKMVPIGGIGGSGINLTIVATPYGGGTASTNAVNTKLATAATPDTNTYEYKVQASYNIGPFINCSPLPWIGSIPGLGPPAPMTFTATGSAEFPEGLNQ